MFTKLVIENLFSYAKAELPLENLGLVLIEGKNTSAYGMSSNGSGKSSLFESILWVLYEDTVRGFRKDEVINERATDGAYGELHFRLKSGEVGYIRRSRKHSIYGTDFQIWVNNEELSQDWSKRSVEDQVTRLIGLDFMGFQYVLMSGQNSRAVLSEARDTDQKSLYQNILIPEEFSDIADRILNDRDTIVQDLTKLRSSISTQGIQLESQKSQLSRLKSDYAEWDSQHDLILKRITGEVEDLKAVETILKSRRSTLENLLSQIGSKIKSHEDDRSSVESKLSQIDAEEHRNIDLKQQEYDRENSRVAAEQSNLRVKISERLRVLTTSRGEELKTENAVRDQYREQLSQIGSYSIVKRSEIEVLVSQQNRSQIELSEFRNEFKRLKSSDICGSRCQHCRSLITEITLEFHLSEIEGKIKTSELSLQKTQEELELRRSQLAELDVQSSKLKSDEKLQEDKLRSIETRDLSKDLEILEFQRLYAELKCDIDLEAQKQVIRNSYSDRRTELHSEQARLVAQLQILKTAFAEVKIAELEEELLKIGTDLKSKELELARCSASTNPHNYESLETTFTVLQTQISDNQLRSAALESDLQYVEFLVEMFSDRGLKSYLFDFIVGPLNQLANEYSRVLTNNALMIEFNTVQVLKGGGLREKFNITLCNSDGSSRYMGNSGGEKKRANICIFKAARELLRGRSENPINCSFYDEFDQDLDEAGLELIFKLMEIEAAERGTVFLITHNDRWRGLFEEKDYKILTVVKGVDKISRLETNW